MSRRLNCVASLALLLVTSAPGLIRGDDLPISLPARLGWLRPRVIDSIIRIDVLHRRRPAIAEAKLSDGAVSERIALSDTGRFVIHYRYVSGDDQLLFAQLHTGELVIERIRQVNGRSETLHFEQVPSGKIKMAYDDGLTSREYTSTGFWSLMMSYPEVCQKQLLPILHALRPDWQTARTATLARQRLWRMAEGGEMPDAAKWNDLVEKLAANSFRQRQQAEDHLIAAGPAVLPTLVQVDQQRLSPEQRRRLRRIRGRLAGRRDDTEKRVAEALVRDRTVWLSMLSASDEHHKLVAAAHLNRILQREIDFDPAGSEQLRIAQIKQLRAELSEH